jgi:hypothetical protein
MERIYIILNNKIGINTSLYLKSENDLLICFLDVKMDITGGLMERKRVEMTVKS